MECTEERLAGNEGVASAFVGNEVEGGECDDGQLFYLFCGKLDVSEGVCSLCVTSFKQKLG